MFGRGLHIKYESDRPKLIMMHCHVWWRPAMHAKPCMPKNSMWKCILTLMVLRFCGLINWHIQQFWCDLAGKKIPGSGISGRSLKHVRNLEVGTQKLRAGICLKHAKNAPWWRLKSREKLGDQNLSEIFDRRLFLVEKLGARICLKHAGKNAQWRISKSWEKQGSWNCVKHGSKFTSEESSGEKHKC